MRYCQSVFRSIGKKNEWHRDRLTVQDPMVLKFVVQIHGTGHKLAMWRLPSRGVKARVCSCMFIIEVFDSNLWPGSKWLANT